MIKYPSLIHTFVMLCFSIMIIISCNNNNDDRIAAGGPCTYDTVLLPAKVIAILKQDSVYADIIYRVFNRDSSIYRDSVSQYIETGHYIESSKINKDSIKAGERLIYQIAKIKSGSCNPHLEILRLERFH